MKTTWYAAHLVMVVRFKEEQQDYFPIWENIVLIEAATIEDAEEKATARGKEDEGDSDGSFTWDGEPATWVFAGIRKLTTCVDSHFQPKHGTEITYTEFLVESEADLHRFVDGEEVKVVISAE